MELTLNKALKKGIEAHKAGKAQEADRYYTAILKADQNILMLIIIWVWRTGCRCWKGSRSATVF